MHLSSTVPLSFAALLLVALASLLTPADARAGSLAETGDIDTTFASAASPPGWRRIYNQVSGSGNDFAIAVARRPGGGYLSLVLFDIGGKRIDLQAFTRDGDIDDSFGNAGHVVHDPGFYNAHAMLVDSAGRIVVVGTKIMPNNGEDVVVVRYRPDGTPDPTFGLGGSRTVGFDIGGMSNEIPFAIVEQPVAGAGSRYVIGLRTGVGLQSIGLIGLTLGGELDTGFGNNPAQHVGRSRLEFVAGRVSQPRALVLVDGDALLIGGSTINSDTDSDLALLLVSSQGQSYGFGSGGGLVLPIDIELPAGNFIDGADALALDAEGRVLVGGHAGYRQIALRVLVNRGFGDLTVDPAFVGQGLPARNNVFVGALLESYTRDIGERPEDRTLFLVGTAEVSNYTVGTVQRIHPEGLRGSPEDGMRTYRAPSNGGLSFRTGFQRVLFDRARPVLFGRSPDSQDQLSDFDGILLRLQTTIDTSGVFADQFE